MALRGRPNKPTALKLLEGNPGKRPININEPKPKPVAPKPPGWLAPAAKKMWKHLAPQLETLGLLTSIDGPAMEAVCQSYATWVECEKYVKENGRTYTVITETGSEYIQQRAEVSIGNKALQAFKSFCSEFGLTPASRCKINTKPATEEDDPMEALLRKQGGG